MKDDYGNSQKASKDEAQLKYDKIHKDPFNKIISAFKDILTPEQWAKYTSSLSKTKSSLKHYRIKKLKDCFLSGTLLLNKLLF